MAGGELRLRDRPDSQEPIAASPVEISSATAAGFALDPPLCFQNQPHDKLVMLTIANHREIRMIGYDWLLLRVPYQTTTSLTIVSW